jgi:RNA polymerase sigma factor (sigma-70 family)
MVGDAELAKDLANCVLERANEQLDRFDANKGDLWTWLHLKARTVVIAHFRRHRLRTVSLDALDGKQEPTCEGPEQVYERAAVWRAVDGLPESERSVLALHFHDGYTWEEVARLLGTSSRTVRRLALCGLMMLQSRL